jgi:hypothetical protein
MSAGEEFKLHAAAVRFLKTVAPSLLVYHPANGEWRRPETARRLRAMGVLPGTFDIVAILHDGRHVYLEAKSARGRLSPAQQAFRVELIKRNIPHLVFRSLDDIAEFLVANSIPHRLSDQVRPCP